MNEKKDTLWQDGVCPMSFPGNAGETAIQHYHLSERQVRAWCKEGCSVECGKLLMKKMEKGGKAKHGNRD
jgi:hypothetical protein